MRYLLILSLTFVSCVEASSIENAKGGVLSLPDRPTPQDVVPQASGSEGSSSSNYYDLYADTGREWDESEKEEDYELSYSVCPSGGGACWFGDSLCIDYASNPSSWCSDFGGDYEASACPGGEDEVCDVPAGGSAEFIDCGTLYFYNSSDPVGICAGAGGVMRE